MDNNVFDFTQPIEENGGYISEPGIHKVKITSITYVEEPGDNGAVFKKLAMPIEDETGSSLGVYGWTIRMITDDMEDWKKKNIGRQLTTLVKTFLNMEQLQQLSQAPTPEDQYRGIANLLENIVADQWLAMKLLYNKKGFIEVPPSAYSFMAKWEDHEASLQADGVNSKLVYISKYDKNHGMVKPPSADDEEEMSQTETAYKSATTASQPNPAKKMPWAKAK